MKFIKKYKALLLIVLCAGVFLVTGSVNASQINLLQPASSVNYEEDVNVDGGGRFNYVRNEGVAFLNGTITNEKNTPVTISDVDGLSLHSVLTGFNNNIKIGDNLIPVETNLNLGSEDKKFEDAFFNGDVRVGNIVGDNVIHINNIATYNNPENNQVLSYDGQKLAWIDQAASSGGSSGGITSVTAGVGLSGGGENGDITLNVSGIKTGMITNGTITGDDINSSADLNVGSLSATGNLSSVTATFSGDVISQGDINQDLADHGAVKAMVYIPVPIEVNQTTVLDSDNIRYWTYNDSNIAVSYDDLNYMFSIDFGFDLSSSYWNVTPLSDASGILPFPSGMITGLNSGDSSVLETATYSRDEQFEVLPLGVIVTIY